MAFFGCLIGTFFGNALWFYFKDKMSRIMFNYKMEKDLEKRWFD